MDKRVYGVIGISSIMANWNADFAGYPKTISNGTTFGSDKALKYPMKKMWDNEGKKVLYIKSMRIDEGKNNEIQLIPRTLMERFIYIFGLQDNAITNNTKTIMQYLFKTIDVKNFGATFAEAGNNISITGAVQIGQGFNKYEDTEVQEQSILSPFRDPNAKEKSKKSEKDEGEEAKNSTLGTKIVSDEAHYFYPFSINPATYNEFIRLGVTEGYTEDDYKEFKRAAIVSTTSFSTNSKAGCENELSIFVETKPDVYLPNLSEYILFTKKDKKNEVALQFDSLLNDLQDKLLSVEIYYNPYTMELISNIKGARYYNIITQKEV